MIELVYSNKTECLLEDLAGNLQTRKVSGAHPLDPVELVVPNRNMETWVSLGLAQSMGIAANLRFRRLERFIGEIAAEACPNEIKLVDLDTIEAAVLTILLDEDMLNDPALQPVRSYLSSAGISSPDADLTADGADLRRVQLATRIAHLFQEYIFSRPEMISAWREGDRSNNWPGKAKRSGFASGPFANPASADPSFASTVAWQRAIWSAVFGENGVLANHPPGENSRWATLDDLAFDDNLFEKIRSRGFPPVHIFGVSYVARIFQILFARLGEIGTLRIYALNPCAEFWEDVETDRDFFRRLEKEQNAKSLWVSSGESEENEDPFGLNEADTPALRYWGRPGREHIRLLDELTDCDFISAFTDPLDEKSGLLHHLQSDILMRKPERNLEQEKDRPGSKDEDPDPQQTTTPHSPDQTLKLVAAPSIRREVEWVADQIWRLMRDDRPQPGQSPLRFSDIAVIVNSAERDLYLPQIEAVFASSNDLPSSVSDLPGSTGSRFIEAMSMLLQLPFGRFSRSEVLNLISHPAVIDRFDDLNPDILAGMTENLGIMFGADHSDHKGTYINEDVYNWDQGIRRLALGAFMTGEKSGDQRIFETNRGRWLVEEIHGSSMSAAARFGLLARSLFADARFVREQRLTLSDWARFYSAQIDAYLYSNEGADSRDRLRLLNALNRLEVMDLGYEVSGRVAAEIALGAIESLSGGRGQYLAEGVVVSSFLPMRAIPFRAVFVLGLGEGLFPASGQRDALDLRAAKRRAGDVDPSERDRYMFLETLLCARDRLYLSYVRRDEQTGDPLQPSAVVQELLHILQSGYLGAEGIKALRLEPALRRYDDLTDDNETFMDEAKTEARVQAISSDLHERFFSGSEAQTDEDLSAGAPAVEESAVGENTAGEKFKNIKQVLSPEAWDKLSKMLFLPGDPPAASSITSMPQEAELNEESSVEAPISISISVIRKFLQCPMQGWASAMLRLAEEGEDLAEREEEDFEVGRSLETKLLRDVFLDAAANRITPAEAYEERITRLRLKGHIPVGVLAQVNAKRHHIILGEWQARVESLQSIEEQALETRDIPAPLHRVRLGRSSEQCSTETVLDPLLLDIPISGPEKPDRITPVQINGQTEALSDDRLTTIAFQPNKKSTSRSDAVLGRSFRSLLRGMVDHIVLSAMHEAGTAQRRIVICHAGDPDQKGTIEIRLRPLDADRARSWLKDVVTDLLNGSHAHLLPCEAVFLEYNEQINLQKKSKKSKTAQTDQGPSSVNGENLRLRVAELTENEWSRFSSLWGPVPSPRSYAPPPAEEAARLAARRFGPLFKDLIDMEGF